VSARETAERLSIVPLFKDCSGRQLRHIAARGHEVTYAAGKTIIEQGKFGDHFFVILEGSARVVRNGRKVNTLGPGASFGEIALLVSLMERSPRTATVIAETDVRCFVLSKGEFRTVIYEQNIAANLLRTMARRLDAASKPSEL
jgi:CRP/FNR family transcriptional regulator, cyclic AMP receptor protein